MLDNSIRDRALGAIVGAAVGDALGASYEFLTASEIASQGDITMRPGWSTAKESSQDTRTAGEWTDDTAMSTVILQTAATHHELLSTAALDSIAAGFQDWADTNPATTVSYTH